MLIGLLKFIFWFFSISYLIKMLARLLAPFLMKRFAKKMQDRFNQQSQNQQKPSQEEGKVTIKKANNSAKIKSDNVGEYVDFEEVDEK
jgi:hypothetical protein